MNQQLRNAIDILEKNKLLYRLLEFEKAGISSKDVEKQSDFKHEEIFKTIVLVDTEGKFYSAFLSGPDRVDVKKVQKHFNSSELRLAKAKELKEQLKIAPGEVCPITINLPTVIDRKITKFEKINFGSGDIYYGIEMKTKDILKYLDAKLEDISE